MTPDPRFIRQPKQFWAYVRAISEQLGYTERGTKRIVVPDFRSIVDAMARMSLDSSDLITARGTCGRLGERLLSYFRYRADLLNDYVEPRLMNVSEARDAYRQLRIATCSNRPVTMNKQKGAKKKPAYLTNIVNMIVEANRGMCACDLDPRRLTLFTRDHRLLRALARRIDGAFPSVINPIAVWEIKEYYHTTTFGSRVADGVYESLLDGMELDELRAAEGVNCKHYLMIDAHYTWWDCGRSYLCRIIDMLNMGYVDEVLVGIEVLDRLPAVVQEWTRLLQQREQG